MNVDGVHQRLKGEALPELAHLVVEHMLDQPLGALVEPRQVARQLVRALDIATRGDEAERWLRERITTLRGAVPEGKVGDGLPFELLDPLRQTLGRPFEPDRELVARLLDHAAVRDLFKDVIRGSLEGFVQRIRNLQHVLPPGVGQGPLGGGLGRLRALGQGVMAVSESVLHQVRVEMEHRMAGRVTEFVDETLALVMAQVAAHITDPAHAGHWGAYRVYLLDTVLDLERARLVEEVEKLDPDHLVKVGVATARALAHRQGFEEEVAGVLRAALDATGGRTLRDFMQESGLDSVESEWRPELEASLVQQARQVVETPAFRAWLERLLAG